jgi:hypothetical protein
MADPLTHKLLLKPMANDYNGYEGHNYGYAYPQDGQEYTYTEDYAHGGGFSSNEQYGQGLHKEGKT